MTKCYNSYELVKPRAINNYGSAYYAKHWKCKLSKTSFCPSGSLPHSECQYVHKILKLKIHIFKIFNSLTLQIFYHKYSFQGPELIYFVLEAATLILLSKSLHKECKKWVNWSQTIFVSGISMFF